MIVWMVRGWCERTDTTALVDQVAGGGGLAGVDMADNDDVDMSLVLTANRQPTLLSPGS